MKVSGQQHSIAVSGIYELPAVPNEEYYDYAVEQARLHPDLYLCYKIDEPLPLPRVAEFIPSRVRGSG
jgi:hypothetical protein